MSMRHRRSNYPNPVPRETPYDTCRLARATTLRVPQSTCEAVFRLLAALPALRRRGLLRAGVLLGNTGSAAAGGHMGRYQVGHWQCKCGTWGRAGRPAWHGKGPLAVGQWRMGRVAHGPRGQALL